MNALPMAVAKALADALFTRYKAERGEKGPEYLRRLNDEHRAAQARAKARVRMLRTGRFSRWPFERFMHRVTGGKP